MSTLNIQLLCRGSIDFQELAIFATRLGAMINLHWLELPMARTIFKGVGAIEVRLYISVPPFTGLTEAKTELSEMPTHQILMFHLNLLFSLQQVRQQTV